MTTTLYLTTEEKKLFDALSPSLQEGWTVEQEDLDCYESDKQIQMRYRLADFSAYPEVAHMVESVVNGEDPATLSLDALPDTVQKELYFTMGARGVNALIRILISAISTDDDIAALAALSAARHELLTINKTATHT